MEEAIAKTREERRRIDDQIEALLGVHLDDDFISEVMTCVPVPAKGEDDDDLMDLDVDTDVDKGRKDDKKKNRRPCHRLDEDSVFLFYLASEDLWVFGFKITNCSDKFQPFPRVLLSVAQETESAVSSKKTKSSEPDRSQVFQYHLNFYPVEVDFSKLRKERGRSNNNKQTGGLYQDIFAPPKQAGADQDQEGLQAGCQVFANGTFQLPMSVSPEEENECLRSLVISLLSTTDDSQLDTKKVPISSSSSSAEFLQLRLENSPNLASLILLALTKHKVHFKIKTRSPAESNRDGLSLLEKFLASNGFEKTDTVSLAIDSCSETYACTKPSLCSNFFGCVFKVENVFEGSSDKTSRRGATNNKKIKTIASVRRCILASRSWSQATLFLNSLKTQGRVDIIFQPTSQLKSALSCLDKEIGTIQKLLDLSAQQLDVGGDLELYDRVAKLTIAVKDTDDILVSFTS